MGCPSRPDCSPRPGSRGRPLRPFPFRPRLQPLEPPLWPTTGAVSSVETTTPPPPTRSATTPAPTERPHLLCPRRAPPRRPGPRHGPHHHRPPHHRRPRRSPGARVPASGRHHPSLRHSRLRVASSASRLRSASPSRSALLAPPLPRPRLPPPQHQPCRRRRCRGSSSAASCASRRSRETTCRWRSPRPRGCRAWPSSHVTSFLTRHFILAISIGHHIRKI